MALTALQSQAWSPIMSREEPQLHGGARVAPLDAVVARGGNEADRASRQLPRIETCVNTLHGARPSLEGDPEKNTTPPSAPCRCCSVMARTIVGPPLERISVGKTQNPPKSQISTNQMGKVCLFTNQHPSLKVAKQTPSILNWHGVPPNRYQRVIPVLSA
jgi:hypothetical protein